MYSCVVGSSASIDPLPIEAGGKQKSFQDLPKQTGETASSKAGREKKEGAWDELPILKFRARKSSRKQSPCCRCGEETLRDLQHSPDLPPCRRHKGKCNLPSLLSPRDSVGHRLTESILEIPG